MDPFIEKLLSFNRQWAQSTQREDPSYFRRLAAGQQPRALLVGCSDSRVSPSVVLGTDLGEIFVHRNIANVVSPTDLNFQSVLQYSVDVLRVDHIIIKGHYRCGGIQAALSGPATGSLDKWLGLIHEVIRENDEELSAIQDFDAKVDRLVEMNVLTQLSHIEGSDIYRAAMREGHSPALHAWVYDFSTGLIRDITPPS